MYTYEDFKDDLGIVNYTDDNKPGPEWPSERQFWVMFDENADKYQVPGSFFSDLNESVLKDVHIFMDSAIDGLNRRNKQDFYHALHGAAKRLYFNEIFNDTLQWANGQADQLRLAL
jgi:hypothetical protein